MNKNYLIWLGGAAAAVALGLTAWIGGNSYVAPPATPPGTPANSPVSPPDYYPADGMVKPVVPIEKQANYIIDITTAGFSPAELKVKKGDSIIWTNRDKAKHQIMADAAMSYPEKGECGSKLNSCVSLSLGDSFRVTFNEIGVWKYSDKLNPKFTGIVIVE